MGGEKSFMFDVAPVTTVLTLSTLFYNDQDIMNKQIVLMYNKVMESIPHTSPAPRKNLS